MNKLFLFVAVLGFCSVVFGQVPTGTAEEPECTKEDLNVERQCWFEERCAATILDGNEYPVCESEPTVEPSHEPTKDPEPTGEPTKDPEPTHEPTKDPEPTGEPTKDPEPTHEPTTNPEPTHEPTKDPEPTGEPTKDPEPTHEPTKDPEPTHEPTKDPEPTGEPTKDPEPTHEPTKDVLCTETGEGCLPCVVEIEGIKVELAHGATKLVGECEYFKCWNGEVHDGRLDTEACSENPTACGSDSNPCKDCEFKLEATGEVIVIPHGHEKELRECVYLKCDNGELHDYKREDCSLEQPPVEEDDKPVAECGDEPLRACRSCIVKWEEKSIEVAHASRADIGECLWVKCWDGVVTDGRYDDTAECREEQKEEEEKPVITDKIEIQVTFVSSDVTKNQEELKRLFELVLSSGATITISEIKKNEDGSYSAKIIIEQPVNDLSRKDPETIKKDAAEIAPFESKTLQLSSVDILQENSAAGSEGGDEKNSAVAFVASLGLMFICTLFAF